MNLQGTKTEKNLMTAFTDESQAHTKYLIFSEIAKNEGYEQISEFFKYTAYNELKHANIWLESLGLAKTTLENLISSESAENFEHTKLYKKFMEEAQEEGFDNLARLFKEVSLIEESHEKRYSELIENMDNKQVFKKNDEQYWECRECGHIHKGKNAPNVCPVCNSEQAYFQIKSNNY